MTTMKCVAAGAVRGVDGVRERRAMANVTDVDDAHWDCSGEVVARKGSLLLVEPRRARHE
jgi:hypothetical protein